MPLNNRTMTEDLTDRCTNCGNCRIICPVFKIKNREIYTARGRINLIKGIYLEELSPGKEVSAIIYSCLNCGQCSKLCPADVKYSGIISSARSRTGFGKKVFSLKHFFYSGLYSEDHQRSELFFKIARFLKNNILDNRKLKFLHFFFRRVLRVEPEAAFPDMPAKDFFRMGKRNDMTSEYRGFRIALFTGCGGKYLYPETADRFVRIMRKNGIQVLIQKDQVCCGEPLEFSGMVKNASKNRAKNKSIFNALKDTRCIVSLCSNALAETECDSSKTTGFRLPVRNWTDIVLENGLDLSPALGNSVIFHFCPKCGDADKYKLFIEELYKDSAYTPAMTKGFCGSTHLLDRSNLEVRDIITSSFYDSNGLDRYAYTACSSFECIEYLNSFFIRKNKKIRAVHIIEAMND